MVKSVMLYHCVDVNNSVDSVSMPSYVKICHVINTEYRTDNVTTLFVCLGPPLNLGIQSRVFML